MKKKFILLLLASLFVVTLLCLAGCSGSPNYNIESVRYDPVTKTLSWYDTSDAQEWVVTINGEEQKTKTRTFSYDAGDKTFWFTIEGLHKKKGHDDNPIASGEMKFIPTPTNLRIENGMLVWDAAHGATSYEIYNFGNPQYHTDASSCQIYPGAFEFYIEARGGEYSYTYPSGILSGSLLGAPSNLKYENGVLSWDAAQGAEFYIVNIDGKDNKVTSTTFAYSGSNKDFTVSVRASASGANSYDSQPLADVCRYLTPVTNYSFDASGNLVWPKVENAEGYSIEFVGGGTSGTTPEPIWANIALDTPYTVKVIPYTSQLSYTGTPIEYSFEKLSPVENIKFNADTNTISWNRHARAVKYELLVNGKTIEADTNQYMIGRTEQDIDIKVYALGSIENSRSYIAQDVKYTFIGSISTPTIVDGKLVWESSAKAAGYKLTFADKTQADSKTAEFSAFEKGRQHTVTVKAYGENEYYFSYPSGQFTFTVLRAPTLRYQQGAVIWDTNVDAGFSVKVTRDGQDFDSVSTSGSVPRYSNEFTAPGKYEIRVKTTSEKTGIYDSEYSKPFEIVRLSAPTGHTILGSKDGVEIEMTGVNGAKGYKVKLNGTSLGDFAGKISLDLASYAEHDGEMVFNVSVSSIGNAGSTPVYLDSKDEYSFVMTRLATPQNVKVEGSTLMWDNVPGAGRYLILINGSEYYSMTSTYEIPSISEGQTKIVVYALSDEANVIMSRPSAELNVTKLKKITDVKVEKNPQGEYITWSIVQNATQGYTVVIGGETYTTRTASFPLSDYISDLNEGKGLSVVVYAKGDGETTIDATPSDTMVVTRFPTPQNITVSGDSITWNESIVDGIKASNYCVDFNNGTKFNTTSNSFSTKDIAPGQYTVSIYALGNNKNILESKYADASITKLGQVTNIVRTAGTKTISWDPVAGAQEYVVTIDGKQTIVKDCSVEYAPTGVGTYKISIYARSNEPNVIGGTAVEFSQNVRAMTTPVKDTAFTIAQEGQYYTLTVNKPAASIPESAISYRVTQDGVIVHSGSIADGVYSGDLEIRGIRVTVRVQYVVGCFDESGNYYIDSNYSADITLIYY